MVNKRRKKAETLLDFLDNKHSSNKKNCVLFPEKK
uniref:Uncharacterized protein n=1 Tax=Lepeophtheirus salmonis TaxID=72036 RepID=A0A0K2UVP8_LEPSM